MSLQSEFAQLTREGGRAALVTVVSAEAGPEVGTRILIPAAGEPRERSATPRWTRPHAPTRTS